MPNSATKFSTGDAVQIVLTTDWIGAGCNWNAGASHSASATIRMEIAKLRGLGTVTLTWKLKGV